MHSLFKGIMGFGLVSIPIQVFKAMDSEAVTSHWVHEECLHRIQYQKYCPACERVVDATSINKAASLPDGRLVILPPENKAGESDHVINILNFPLLDEVDPVFYDQAYWVKPSSGGSRAYAILVAAMRDMGRVALAEMRLRSRPSLAIVRAFNEHTLMMHRMHYPDSLREEGMSLGPQKPQFTQKELALAVTLIGEMKETFVPENYPNQPRLDRLAQIEELGESVAPQERAPSAAAMDLMEQLRRSVEQQSRHGQGVS